jgi:hypothetical protein
MTQRETIQRESNSGLRYFKIEASYQGHWVDLNDMLNYSLASDTSLTSTARPWRKITATSPVMDGEYLVHATLGMVTESLKWWVHGQTQVDLAENLWRLEEIFDQYSYRLRLYFDDYVETWDCQLADTTTERQHVYMHSIMAAFTASVPRFPEVSRLGLEG